MLVAYGPDGQPVIAHKIPLRHLQQWSREHLLHCPNCRGIVHVRGGSEKRTQLHFAHQKGECAWSTESESVRHATGKMLLAAWLLHQFPQATIALEERLPEPNRIADIFVAHADGERWAIEFQCATLDLDEWRHRHTAYHNANIRDIWIIGNNRREKQEAFIEAILTQSREILFLDPLVTPPRIWLCWPITQHTVREWQNGKYSMTWTSSLNGRVGHAGYAEYGATLTGQLSEVCLNEHGQLIHPARATLEARTHLLHTMSVAPSVNEEMLSTYLRQNVKIEAIHIVIMPLLRAYLLDPDLMRRYNYGRGQFNQELSDEDRLRVMRARKWLRSLEQKGFASSALQELSKEIPFVGPYAAFAKYLEMLLTLL